MAPRIRVKRSELIKTVEGRIRKLDADHKRATEAFPAQALAYEEAVAAALKKALASAERGKLPETIYSDDVRIHVGRGKPTKPGKRHYASCNLERLLKSLKIGAEDTVLLAVEDADQYFGPCEL